jgi:hypothetical protein
MLLFFWFIENLIVKKFLIKYQEMNVYVETTLKNRKIIMFDLIVLVFLIIIDVNFFSWISIIYYTILSIIGAILLLCSLISGIFEDTRNKFVNRDLWILFISNFIEEVTSIIILIVSINILN